MRNFNKILFDFDGTLFDSQLGIKNAVQYALLKVGIEENNQDTLQSFIGPPLHYSFENHYGFDKVKVAELVKDLRVYYSSKGYKETELYIGVEEMLNKIKASGKTMAIATAKPTIFANQILKDFNLSHYFDSVQGSSSKGELFPKDRVIGSVLKDLGVYDNSECVMIGDTLYDIKGAEFHGIYSIGVSYGYGKVKDLKNARANVIVDTVGELSDLLI